MGLERFGYRKSPLEVIAFKLQHRFQREAQPFSVEAACQSLMREMASPGDSPAPLDGP